MQGILIVMYSYSNEQAIRARVADQRDAHACVVGDEKLNALGCIWLKTDLLAT